MRFFNILAAGCLALIAATAQAENVSGLYQVREPVTGQGAEAAQATHDFRACGAFCHALDAFDQCFAGVDVYTGVLVAQGGLLAH